MAFSSSCFCHFPISHKLQSNQAASFALGPINSVLSSKQFKGWSFLGGSRLIIRPNLPTTLMQRRSSRSRSFIVMGPSSSGLENAEVANGVFPLGSVAVLPFYLPMVVAPKAKLTQKVMESNIPYTVLGLLYSYLFSLSWTPDKLQLLFPANTSWIPELAGIAKMFSREMTLASVWIHLLTVDLFAARQVYRDGLQNDIETRQSVSLMMLSCPLGLLSHFITKKTQFISSPRKA